MIRTQSELAKKLGVSQMTISRVLNNTPGVGPKLRSKILSYIKKEAFATNRIASSLATGRTKLIGLLVPNVTYSFFPEITDTVEEICRHRGYHTILCHTGEDYGRTASQIRLLTEMRVDGLIIVPPSDCRRTDIYAELDKRRIPFVFIDRYIPGLKSSFVLTDARKGSHAIAAYLISLGHRRITFIKGPESASSAAEVYAGYRTAMNERKLEKSAVKGGFGEKDGYKAARQILKRKVKPTAIMAVNDPVAIGALQALTEMNVKVPDQISLTGFSDISAASKLNVPLTTVRENTQAMGRLAVDLLFRMIAGRKKVIEEIRLEPELVIRKSTKSV